MKNNHNKAIHIHYTKPTKSEQQGTVHALKQQHLLFKIQYLLQGIQKLQTC